MRARLCICILAAYWTSACATPDVKPFVEQTAALELSIAAEKKAVGEKLDDLILLIEKGNSTTPPSFLRRSGRSAGALRAGRGGAQPRAARQSRSALRVLEIVRCAMAIDHKFEKIHLPILPFSGSGRAVTKILLCSTEVDISRLPACIDDGSVAEIDVVLLESATPKLTSDNATNTSSRKNTMIATFTSIAITAAVV